MSAIDEVKQRLDIVEVIGEYTSLTKAGKTFKALCPFHSEKNPSFYVYPEQQSWHCFGACNTGGDVFSFIMKKQGVDFGEALRLLAQKTGVVIPTRSEPEAGRDERERLYQVNQAAAQYFHNLLLNSAAGEKARDYLDRRGVSLETLINFQLGYSRNSWEALKQYLSERGCSESEILAVGLIIEGEAKGTHDRFRNKLMFPIFDLRGRVTGFGARVLDDSLPKYINSPQTPVFDKSGTLYGINLATTAIREQDRAILVEGYMDVITAHQNGFKNVVASMGTAVTEKQINTLKKLTRNVVLALDADAAGEEAMLRCVGYEDTIGDEIKVIILPGGRDPDDVIREDATRWQYLVEQALPVVDYTINMVVARLDITSARDKSIAVDKLLPIIAEIKDPIRQAHYIQKLAQLLKVSLHTIEAALARFKTRRIRRKTEEPKPEALARAVRLLVSSPVEEYCLALLLQHPELKNDYRGLSPDYFESSENREIFLNWQQANDLPSLKKCLDTSIHEQLDSLMIKKMPANQIEQKYADCVLNLRRIYLQNREAKRAEALASEAEARGTRAELAKLEEQGIEVSAGLREVFTQKSQRRLGQRR